jgi:hypothetical protein
VFYQVLRLLSEKTLINLKIFYTKKDKLTIKLFLPTKQFKTKLSVFNFFLFFSILYVKQQKRAKLLKRRLSHLFFLEEQNKNHFHFSRSLSFELKNRSMNDNIRKIFGSYLNEH